MDGTKAHMLAIVIPAYKRTFFREALQSIASQTNKDFVVYIGDDGSPEDLYSVVQEFAGQLQIKYHRFEKNMGGTDLVAHWHRCIALSNQEPWIWLFSDDDLMDANCVAAFYNTLNNQGADAELLHFNVKVINERSELTGNFQPFPECLSVADFFHRRITYALSSYVVEYIFRRALFEQENGFEKFDLAWCSDDATWIKFGKRSGIATIQDGFVRWRFSQINISSKVEDRTVILRKLAANEAFLKWVRQFFLTNGIVDKTTPFQKLKWMLHQFLETSVLTLGEKLRHVDGVVDRLGYKEVRTKARVYVFYMTIKRKWKNRSKQGG